VKIFTRENVCVLVGDPHWMKFLDMCDELSNECSLDKDQVLSMWVILCQKCIRFFSCILLRSFYDEWLCGAYSTTYLCVSKDLVKNQPHRLGPFLGYKSSKYDHLTKAKMILHFYYTCFRFMHCIYFSLVISIGTCANLCMQTRIELCYFFRCQQIEASKGFVTIGFLQAK
jgi:hypothetical protein